MADQLALDLIRKKLMTNQLVITIEYDVLSANNQSVELKKDRYGRKVPKHAHGTVNLDGYSDSEKEFMEKSGELFDKIINPELLIRRIYITANHVKYYFEKKPLHQLSIFTDYRKKKSEDERSTRREQAILEIKSRYGKNAILRGLNFEKGATQIDRNNQVGGHKA